MEITYLYRRLRWLRAIHDGVVYVHVALGTSQFKYSTENNNHGKPLPLFHLVSLSEADPDTQDGLGTTNTVVSYLQVHLPGLMTRLTGCCIGCCIGCCTGCCIGYDMGWLYAMVEACDGKPGKPGGESGWAVFLYPDILTIPPISV